MKRFFAAIISVMLCLSLATPAFASSTPSETEPLSYANYPTDIQKESIITSLQHIENLKQSMGLDNVSFSEISVGERLHTYNYTSTGFEESWLTYPLFCNNNLFAVARETSGGHFQITTALAEKIRESGKSNVAIVCDVNSCYLFDGADFSLLQETTTEVTTRLSLSNSEARSIIDTSELESCDLSISTSLDYTSELMPLSTSTYFECSNVKYVTQNPPSNLCWAATIACIKNAVSSTSLTAVNVAQKKYGTSDYDKTISNSDIASFMKNSYSLSYTHKTSVPSDTVIKKNMSNGYPIFGIFSWVSSSRSTTKSYHDGTIYGIDTADKYIAIMDPEFGATVSYKSGSSYKYISDWSGVELTFAQALCQSW